MAVLQIGGIIICIPCDDILTEKIFKLFTLQLFEALSHRTLILKFEKMKVEECYKLRKKPVNLFLIQKNHPGI